MNLGPAFTYQRKVKTSLAGASFNRYKASVQKDQIRVDVVFA